MSDKIIADFKQCLVLQLVQRGQDLFLILADGTELRMKIEARYCDDAWLVIEQYRDGKLEWEQSTY